MWIPRFACPACARPLGPGAPVTCACGADYGRLDDVHAFVPEARCDAGERYARQYAAVRRADGHRRVLDACGDQLPTVPPELDPFGEWQIRRESYVRLLTSVVGPVRRRILDAGAGCGWLSARLSARGHDVVALDRFDDPADLDAMRRRAAGAFVAVAADFETMPFEPGQFDLVVFNASLHYAPDPGAVLEAAAGLLAHCGALVVMDSPLFTRDEDGEAMVADGASRLAAHAGLQAVIRPGRGYLTFAGLAEAAAALDLCARFFRSRGTLSWRVRRSLGRWRLDRAPATFGVWVAR